MGRPKTSSDSLLLKLAQAEVAESAAKEALEAAEKAFEEAQKVADQLSEKVVEYGRKLLADNVKTDGQ